MGRFAAFGLGLAFVSSLGQTFFIGLFGGAIQHSLGIDPGQWGLAYAIATLCSGGLMFWAGAQADHRPVRHVLLVSLGLLAAGAAMMAMASSFVGIIVALFALRFGGQGLAGHLAMVVASQPSQRRGRSLSIAAFGFIIGEALLPVSVVALLGLTGWRELWWLGVGFTGLVALPVLWLLAGRLPMAADHQSSKTVEPLLDRRTLLRTPVFGAALSAFLVSPFVVTAVFLQQATVIELRGWSHAVFASGFLLFAVVQAISNWLAGALVDRFGAALLFRLYLLPLVVACLALGFAPPQWGLWMMFAGLGASAGAQGVVGSSMWVELFGLRQLGLVRGVYFGFMVVTTAVSPFLLGAALSAQVPLGLIFSVIAVYAAVVPWVMGRVLDTHPRPSSRVSPDP